MKFTTGTFNLMERYMKPQKWENSKDDVLLFLQK